MWVGVIVVTAVILVVWIGFMRSNLSRPLPSDSFLQKIRGEVSNFFSRVRFFQVSPPPTNRTDTQLEELRTRVFPTLKDQQFTTTNTNAQANVNQTP